MKKKFITMQLYNYINQNGFDFSMSEIAEKIGISSKTLFNHYGSKKNLIKSVKEYWKNSFYQKVIVRSSAFNNDIEILLYVIYELNLLRVNNPIFFNLDKKNGSFFEYKSHTNIIAFIQKLISNESTGIFKHSEDPGSLSEMIVFNIIYFINDNCKDTFVISQIMQAILTEHGLKLFKEIDLLKFLDL